MFARLFKPKEAGSTTVGSSKTEIAKTSQSSKSEDNNKHLFDQLAWAQKQGGKGCALWYSNGAEYVKCEVPPVPSGDVVYGL